MDLPYLLGDRDPKDPVNGWSRNWVYLKALTYDTGYFYPGPVTKNVPYSLAPTASQDVLREFGRIEHVVWGLNYPHVQPLPAKLMNIAFEIWDERWPD